MNFLFISPNYPPFYYKFCKALKDKGVRVFGIGDSGNTCGELKECLSEYYVAQNMQDFAVMCAVCEQVERTYGRIDGLDSNNEFWLETEGRLRERFGVAGLQGSLISYYKEKSKMKERFIAAGVSALPWVKSCDKEDVIAFCKEQGYPVFCKPDNGVGAVGVHKLSDLFQLGAFLDTHAFCDMIFEPYVEGELYSFDGLCDKDGDIVFCACHLFDTPIDRLKESGGECVYRTDANVPKELEKVGRAAVSAFELKSRFFHIEFFKLTKPIAGVGNIGDFVSLEANMRIAGGYTPEMLCYGLGLDIYALWAAVICGEKPKAEALREKRKVVNVSRSDSRSYLFSVDQIRKFFGHEFIVCERTSYGDNPFGNYEILGGFTNEQRLQLFIEMVVKTV